MRWRIPLLVIVPLLLLGCGPAQSTKPRLTTTDVRPGHVRMGVADRLSWPYRLERVLVVIDGEPMLRLDPGEDPGRATVELPIAAGVHTLAVQVVAALPSGARDQECLVRLRTSLSFGAGHDPMSILLVPFLGDQTAEFADRLELEIRFAGTRPIAEVEHLGSPTDTVGVGCPSYSFGPVTERMAFSEGCGDPGDLLEDDRL